MGHRACFILIESEKERTFYYSRYGSFCMDNRILGGFESLLNFIRDNHAISEMEWLGKCGAQDGEMLMDCQNRVLIWNGEGDASWNPVYRQVFLQVVRDQWQGWDIRFAYNVAQDILNYAGYPQKPLNLERFKDEPQIQLDPAQDGLVKEILPGILSILDSNQQCRLIPLNLKIYGCLLSGPAFFSRWEEVPQLEKLVIDTIHSEGIDFNGPRWCGGGIHLNLLEQKMEYWVKYFIPGIEQLIAPMWPGWQITIHFDEFVWQEKITNGALSFKVESMSEILEELLPLKAWLEKPIALENQEIEETIGKLATRSYELALIIKIMVYLILIGILVLFLWPLMT